MPSKRRLTQLKSARAAAVLSSKRRKVEASLVLNSAQHDDKLSTTDTSDTEGESRTWFWNESANEIDPDSEEEGEGDKGEEEGEDNKSNPETEEPRTERAVSPEIKIKWNKGGEDKLRRAYGNGSTSTSRRIRKAALELEKKASKTYDIRKLWQRNIDLGRSSAANRQVGLGQMPESQPNNNVSSPSPLSKIRRGGTSLLSNQESLKNQRTEGLKDLNKLLKLVTEQEKKYETRISPHRNFYRRHIMVQQFLQSQLSSQPSKRRYLVMWLDHLGEGGQLHVILFDGKKNGLLHENFRRGRKGKIPTRGCRMVI